MKASHGLTTLLLGLFLGAAFAPARAQDAFIEYPADHWAYQAQTDIQQRKIMLGYPNGYFAGKRVTTRREMVIAFQRLMAEKARFTAIGSSPVINGLLAAFSPPAKPGVQIQDGSDSWSGQAAEELAAIGIVQGYPGAYWRPRGLLSRGELATIAARLIQRMPNPPRLKIEQAPFRDLDGGEWYFGDALLCIETGVMSGYSDHTFRANQPATRYELVVVLERILELADKPASAGLDKVAMNRRKRPLAIVVVFLVLLVGLPCGLVFRQVEQEHKDQALIEAIKAKDTQKALNLLEDGADGNACDRGAGLSSREVLLRLLDRLWRPGSTPIGPPKDKYHLPAIFLAYRQMWSPPTWRAHQERGPDIRLIRALLDHHVPVNQRDYGGSSPLFWASLRSNPDTVRLLLERGADIEAATPSPYGTRPLMVADAGVIGVLLEHGAKIEATDDRKQTALFHAAQNGEPEVARILLEHGAKIETRNMFQQTPLLVAVISRRTDVARVLLEHGAKLSPKDGRGWTVLDYARYLSKNPSDPDAPKLLALLRKYGAK